MRVSCLCQPSHQGRLSSALLSNSSSIRVLRFQFELSNEETFHQERTTAELCVGLFQHLLPTIAGEWAYKLFTTTLPYKMPATRTLVKMPEVKAVGWRVCFVLREKATQSKRSLSKHCDTIHNIRYH